MQSLPPPVCLGTTTVLASHVGFATSRMMRASFNFSTSLMMNSYFFGAWRRAFCFTGRAFGHTAKWCSITSLGTPDISDGVHANMSEFALRKATSALSYLGGKPAPMVTLAPEPSAPEPLVLSDTFFVDACS